MNRVFTLEQAIELVPDSRRVKGMKISYLTRSGDFKEATYLGDSSETSDWMNLDNWQTRADYIIDGGEW
jgi:hypothetical protein